MRKDKVIKESKNYLIAVHDSLRRTFRNSSQEEQIFISSILQSIEQDVELLESLEEIINTQKIKDKKETTIEE